ncbi:MAG: glycoside hydrolase family 2, partial [Planctomycetaceae bacterium]|nr:glycoside hydrolase family 2 [Planctomycetaceae bacterium]
MYRFLLMNLVLFAAAPLGWSQDVSDGPWKYVLRKPGPRWVQADFNDERWREGFGGFGERSTPGSRVGTEWTTPDIWLRRTVELKKVPAKPALLLHHDENLQVFINGTEVVSLTGYITEYKVVPLDQKAAATLKEGSNLLAVHCHQTGGGQFVDVHIIDADHVPQLPEPPRPEHPFKTELMTQWGEKVTPENAWREYPRPALMRDQWTNLNGLWDYAVTDIAVTETPAQWDGDILVPFCLESKLSGVQKLLHPDQALWYHRELDLQPVSGQQTWLNFEAVDYECSVWLNGQQVGGHVGGNVPFSVDLSKAAKPGKNTLIVRVTDATGGTQLRGKQRTDPNGIWYTRVSGIWQTVWLEQRSVRHIDDLKISTDIGKSSITVKAILNGDAAEGEALQVTVRDGSRVVATAKGSADGVSVTVPSAKLWSPDNPFLYDLDVALLNAGGAVVDSVKSYAGLREVGKVRDADGHL